MTEELTVFAVAGSIITALVITIWLLSWWFDRTGGWDDVQD